MRKSKENLRIFSISQTRNKIDKEIKKLIERMSARKLSELTGVTYMTAWRWKTGRNKPSYLAQRLLKDWIEKSREKEE